jgi:hypothetical protein
LRCAVGQRRGYKHIGDALWRISREESFSALFRGLAPTVQRAMVVNMVQCASYDQAKTVLRKHAHIQDGVGLHLGAAVTAGFTYSIASLPLDIAKTRMQNQVGFAAMCVIGLPFMFLRNWLRIGCLLELMFSLDIIIINEIVKKLTRINRKNK